MSALFGSLLSYLQWLLVPLWTALPARTPTLTQSTRPFPHSCATVHLNVANLRQFPSFQTSVQAPLAP
ncbi:MAG: hypothetical protein EBR17_00910 [Betaproteobacteria bacterium]|jgi:hypothetical protein|nr:hypothetical protein [Betaproteobacteria bacterium]NBX90891.1 hypothetical protein [Betaproteobacteria bacterium]